MSSRTWPPVFRYPGATSVGYGPPTAAEGNAEVDDGQPKPAWQQTVATRIGRRIRFLEDPQVTAYWIANERRIFGQAQWHPTYGMTGTIIDVPPAGTIGGGPKVRWDNGRESWLGSVSRYAYI